MKSVVPAPEMAGLGAGSAACAQLVRNLAGIDWFEPSPADDADDRARALLDRHGDLARPWLPDGFPPSIVRITATGDLASFAALVQRRQSGDGTTWDWKFEALKPLALLHAKARGWSREALAATIEPWTSPLVLLPGAPKPVALWMLPAPHLTLDHHPTAVREAIHWYLSYVHMDLIEAIEWQLAEATDDTDGNPFVPLLDVYRLGVLPFSFHRGEMTLFRVSAQPS